MKRYFSAFLCGFLCFTALAGCGGGSESPAGGASNVEPPAEPKPPEEPSASPDPVDPASLPDTVKGTITMEDGGTIVFELYPKIAPQSVYNFVSLARDGFYDGLKFHRIMSGFMIQGGCPDGTGTGNPGYSIFGEFAKNGFENDLTHERGVLSMARQNDPMYNTAGSQFFIVHGDSDFLDGGYAGFGRVISGMDVVDKIAATPSQPGSGAVAKADMPVIKSITIDDDITLPEPDKLPR